MAHEHIHIGQKGQGKNIVVLHGWGVNSHIFAPLYEALADYSVHYVDLPGFGDSDPLSGDLDEWVDAIFTRVPVGSVWIGWSLGGLVAMRAALRYPKQLAGLVTVTSSPHFVAEKNETNSGSHWPGIAPKVLAQFFRQLEREPSRTIERFLAIQAMGSDHAKQDIKRIKQLLLDKPTPSSETLRDGLKLLQTIDLRRDVDKITLPWLRLWGRNDSLVPAVLAQQLPQQSNCQDFVFEHASHAPFISHPELFNKRLLDWLSANAK